MTGRRASNHCRWWTQILPGRWSAAGPAPEVAPRSVGEWQARKYCIVTTFIDSSFDEQATQLYRLDARPRVRRNVSNALLRLLAQLRSAPDNFFCMVAPRRNPACSALYFSGGTFRGAGHGKNARKG